MTNDQFFFFQQTFEQRSKGVRNYLARLKGTKTPAQLKDKLKFSHRELAFCLGCSPSQVKQVVLYNRPVSDDGLEHWRDLIRQAVRIELGEVYSVKFVGRLAFEVYRPCPVCGRARIVHYKGQSTTCRTHG